MVIVGFLTILNFSSFQPNALNCRQVLLNMFDSIKQVNTIRYHLVAAERVNGKMLTSESNIKIQVIPRKIYLKSIQRDIDVLWRLGENNNNAYVRAKVFPVTVNLDPYGSIMRNKQHHTIHELGFAHIGLMIANGVLKTGKAFDAHFHLKGKVMFSARSCYQVEVDFDDYKFIEYVVGSNETVSDIAKKQNTAEYRIRELNNLTGNYSQLKQGSKLQIPKYYGKKTIVYIDEKLFLPVYLKVIDEQGVYEEYSFSNVIVNSIIPDAEFQKKYPDYNF